MIWMPIDAIMGVFTLADTEIDTETHQNGLFRIVWRCLYCTETDTTRIPIGLCVLVSLF